MKSVLVCIARRLPQFNCDNHQQHQAHQEIDDSDHRQNFFFHVDRDEEITHRISRVSSESKKKVSGEWTFCILRSRAAQEIEINVDSTSH